MHWKDEKKNKININAYNMSLSLNHPLKKVNHSPLLLSIGGEIHSEIRILVDGLITDPGGYWWPPTYSNLLILTIFISSCFSVMMKFLCNCGFCTSGAFLKPYTKSRSILVASYLFELN